MVQVRSTTAKVDRHVQSAQDGRHFSTGVHLTRLPLVCKAGDRCEVEIRADGVPGDPGGDGWIYYAWPVGDQTKEDEQYMADFRRIAADVLMLQFVTNDRLPPEFHGCGLTAVLIEHVARTHGVRVCSSSNRGSEDESGTPQRRECGRAWSARGVRTTTRSTVATGFRSPDDFGTIHAPFFVSLCASRDSNAGPSAPEADALSS